MSGDLAHAAAGARRPPRPHDPAGPARLAAHRGRRRRVPALGAGRVLLPGCGVRGADRPAGARRGAGAARHRHPDLPVARPLRVRAHPLPRRCVPVGRARRGRRRGAVQHRRHRRARGGRRPARPPCRRPRCSSPRSSRRPPRVRWCCSSGGSLRREFDGVTDGMVYAGICAAGFAFTENIEYLAQAYAERRRRGAHRHLRGPLPDVALRAPDVHGALRDRASASPRPAAPGCRASSGRCWATCSPCSATPCGTSRRSRAAAGWSWSTCSSRCRSSWRSSGSSCGPGAARAASSGSSCAPTRMPGGSRPPRSRCSRRCRSAARPGPGRGPTPAARGWRRCAPSRTPRASSPCCAGGCTTRPPTSTRLAHERELLEALRARRAEFVGMPGA